MATYPSFPTYEPFAYGFPTYTAPTYQPFGQPFPELGQLPQYQPFGQPYPELELPRYQAYQGAYPTLGGLYGQTQDVIGKLLSGEITELPVEDIMEAYTAEQKRVLGEYMPKLRESWAARGLLRSGMAAGQEREAIEKAAEAAATTRAGLEKESALLRQQGIQAALGPAMQHARMGYEAELGAYQAGLSEYEKEYQSNLQAGMAENEAKERAWKALEDQYGKAYTSQLQNIMAQYTAQKEAYDAARDEYHRAYEAAVAAGKDEYTARRDAYIAAYDEFKRQRQEAFNVWSQQMSAAIEERLVQLGVDADEAARRANTFTNLLAGIGYGIGGPVGGLIGLGLSGLFSF